MAEELGERTEQPTGRRRSEARNRGKIPKSQDLSAGIDLLGALVLIATCGGYAITGLGALMRRVLEGSAPGDPLDPTSFRALGAFVAIAGARVALPALGIIFVVAFTAQFVQVGWLFTTDPLKPNLAKLNPVAGLSKLLNRRSLVKVLVNSVKLGVIGVVAALVLRDELPAMASLPRLEMVAGLFETARMALRLVLWLLPMLLLIGLVDLIYQRWQHTQDLKMTRQEVTDERKAVEGDPEVKRRRLKMAYEIAMQRIRHAVPKADVVVTNPTHFSVALRYDAATMRAPRVTAKGADHLAWTIRHVALESGVPIVERPPLARALYWGVEVGQEISPEHYEAVAEVLAYVYRLEGTAA